jgi:hypothetical protein
MAAIAVTLRYESKTSGQKNPIKKGTIARPFFAQQIALLQQRDIRDLQEQLTQF